MSFKEPGELSEDYLKKSFLRIQLVLKNKGDQKKHYTFLINLMLNSVFVPTYTLFSFVSYFNTLPHLVPCFFFLAKYKERRLAQYNTFSQHCHF